MIAHPTYLRLLILLLLPLVGLAQNTPTPMTDYRTDWQKADSLMTKGLPKSALAIADRVYAAAKKANNYPQLTKAAMRRVVFSTAASREENTFLTLIKALRGDVATASAPAKAILQSVLADVYWQYYQSNRYRFMNRTSVSPGTSPTVGDKDKADDDDPREWDARHLASEVTNLYLTSVQDEKLLQQTPAETYAVVSSPGNAAGRALRSTLYDLLAHRAIDFFGNTEADVTRPTYRFELDKAEYLAEPVVFTKTALTSQDTLSGKFQALLLYQKLVALHLTNKDPLALAAVDAERLAFAHRHSVVADKEARYRQTLTTLVARYKNQTSDAEAEYAALLIEALSNGSQPSGRNYRTDTDDDATAQPDSAHRWDRKQAAELARDLIKRRPNAFATQRVRPVLDNLLRASLGVQIEEANAPNAPFRARVAYTNLKTLFYKIVRVTPDEARDIRTNYYQQYDKRTAQLERLLSRESVADGQVDLPDDGDLRNHSVEMPVAGLPMGHYAMLVSNVGTFEATSSNPDEILQVGQFAVSRLAYLTPRRNNESDTAQVTYVTDRMTGKRLAGVSAQLWQSDDRNNRVTFKKGATFKTNEQGKLAIRKNQLHNNASYFLRFIQQDDVFDSDVQYNYDYQYNRNKPQKEDEIAPQARFFTDRAIYRPGQTIHWKALIFKGANNEFAVVPNDEINVQLRDVNNETVAKITLKTNEFGTASGTFTAPVGRLTGQMTITTTEYVGEASIRVEEYKRPTFAVVADPLTKAVVLGQTVPVRVVAKTLAGANLDGASVAYRVTRTQYQPYWGGGYFGNAWWRPYRPSPQQEISNGTATTDADGVASLTFVAVPDRSIAESSKPQFTYTVTIDVTDASGETRSTTQSLRIGYAPFSVELPLPGTMLTTDKTAYAVRLTNASGNGVGLKEGSVRISRLTPTRPGPLRNRLWERPDRELMTRAEFEKQFPLDLYADENNPANWTKTPVRTTDPRSVTLAGLAPGTYAAEVTAQDSTGKTGQETVYFTVRDEQVPTPSERMGEFVQVVKTTALPGQEAVFWVGSPTGEPVLMAVETVGKPISEQWLFPKPGKPLRVALPVSEGQRGGFMVHFACVQNGRLLTKSQSIAVPFTNKQLTVETETFRDKLQPGQPEQWTLRVSGPDKDKVLAEMVATLYDASLDEFVKLDWPDSFYSPSGFPGDYWQSTAFGVERAMEYREPAGKSYPNETSREYPVIGWYPYSYDPYRGRFMGGYSYSRGGKSSDSYAIIGEVVDGLVKGQIKSATEALPGVSVSWKGTTTGTTTDAQGRFSLVLSPKSTTLVFSYVGYVTTQVKLGIKTIFKATLSADSKSLQEVIVAGYGGRSRQAMAGAVAKMAVGGAPEQAMAAPMAADALQGRVAGVQVQKAENQPDAKGVEGGTPPVIRKNFNETAFFFPQLLTDKDGRVVLTFTMPEALTRWRLMTFAHTKTMQTGSMEATAQTQKELMVTTNVPRFFRENDTLRLTARLDNLSGKPLSGTAKLELTDALTGEPLNNRLVPSQTLTQSLNRSFTINTTSSVAVWTLIIPQNLPPVAVRVTAQAGSFSDGEERVVPVLPNRILVTDVQPIWIDGGNQTKTFRLKPLVDRSPELPMQTERLTVEVTNNPAWYALQSLPYLMEYPYDCAEQLFSKLYANALGASLLSSRPAFRQAVDLWKQTPPKSPLLKNEELKAVTIENTPWLAEAKSETERTAKLGQFFDQNNLAAEQRRAIDKLKKLQTASGGLMWFPGMRPSAQMTLHVMAGLGHLQKLGVSFTPDIAADVADLQQKGLGFIDADARQQLAEHKREEKRLNKKLVPYWAAYYLYARSFYQAKNPLDKAFLADLTPALTTNPTGGSLQGQAMSALALFRYGYTSVATSILQSVTEHSQISDELGMYWPDNQSGTYWYQAPVETQANLIEAYLEVGKATNSAGDGFAWYRKQPGFSQTTDNQVFIDKMRQWLIQQKRTQSWPSTKATTEAIYALLLTGSDWMDTKATTTVRLGGQDIAKRVTNTEALTGYQKVTFAPAEVTQQMGVIEVSKSAKTGISWGGVYWQHFEPLDAVQKAGNNLTIKKNIFRIRNTNAGPVLDPITPQTPLKPGDKLSVRVVLTTDRVMEYVHLKDGRASGFEPVAVLSGTKYQNGLSYYEAPRDASTDFFIERLPVGTHVFEYNLRVVHGGDFSTGIAEVQCFYAPEFAAHSTGTRVQVK